MPDDETSKRLVAIAVPLTSRPCFTESEKLSLRHLHYHLGNYDRYYIAPTSRPGPGKEGNGIRTMYFSEKYFGSARAHNRLMLSKEFYESFSDYEFILIYHLDSLVFSNQLREWCEADYDYVAPPWTFGPDFPWLRQEGVGNGGFSLRKVSSFLRVLGSRRFFADPDEYWKNWSHGRNRFEKAVNVHRKYLKRLRTFNGVRFEIRKSLAEGPHEDFFWAWKARHFNPDFRIATVETALRFAFEGNPRACFERNGGHLPFGCHAWERYDRDFWMPFLLRESGCRENG